MCVIHWDATLETGVTLLDRQHKQLVGLMNELHDSMQNKTIDHTLSQVFSQLTRYIDEHFSSEESLFYKGYPRSLAEKHYAEHQSFREQITLLKQRFLDDQTLLISLEIVSFLMNWLVNHIQNTDKKLAEYLLIFQELS